MITAQIKEELKNFREHLYKEIAEQVTLRYNGEVDLSDKLSFRFISKVKIDENNNVLVEDSMSRYDDLILYSVNIMLEILKEL